MDVWGDIGMRTCDVPCCLLQSASAQLGGPFLMSSYTFEVHMMARKDFGSLKWDFESMQSFKVVRPGFSPFFVSFFEPQGKM